MYIEELAESIRTFEGVTRKKPISDIIRIFETVRPEYGDAIVDFGDDAAVIDIGTDDVILFAADAIWGKIVNKSPWWTGYTSVVVNVNDISAMGGKPLAMVNVMSSSDHNSTGEVMKGIRDGIKKFGVPMVGGHMHPDTPYNSLAVAIIGIAKKDSVIRSDTARPDDVIIAAYDMEGRVGQNSPYSWDTTSFKEPAVVRERFMVMQEIGQKGLVTAGKDISNPGTIGTLGMLCEVSRTGASVDLRKIPRPDNVDFEQWLKIYPATGYILTAKKEKSAECIEVLEKAGLKAAIIGKIEEVRKLDIYDDSGRTTVFDLSKDGITGIGI
ncbi:methanogenesis marker 2 protein [Methanolobus halotolerans]|uniref:Methanogenesis marker 2 protein n=1 Tax=Methanolobus halotolerans TaxID=2052935 RepID=A0A4E0PUM8_9EURY|nr:methanogenesis marker 2 protein [Methanolobus halotolerans]TGC07007.1 methanogenesis marker 2 protein [Methanolobus halotolerans]